MCAEAVRSEFAFAIPAGSDAFVRRWPPAGHAHGFSRIGKEDELPVVARLVACCKSQPLNHRTGQETINAFPANSNARRHAVFGGPSVEKAFLCPPRDGVSAQAECSIYLIELLTVGLLGPIFMLWFT